MIEGMENLWKYRKLDSAGLHRDRALRFEGPSGRLCYGLDRMSSAIRGIQASIPDGEFSVHHVIVREDEAKPARVAMRWTYSGTHSGAGIYGDPTGCPLSILAISHFELRSGKVVNEWMLADDLSIFAQIGAYGAMRV
jgi:predicted ester cyclase